MASDVVRLCPGLQFSPEGMLWINSLNQEIDLKKEPKLSPGETAIRMKRSTEWVLQQIRKSELYPVVSHNPRFLEVYECAITDYYARHTQPAGHAKAS